MRFIGEIHENIILPRLLGKHLDQQLAAASRARESAV